MKNNQNIIVVDLDETLLPFDTMRYLTYRHIFIPQVIYYIAIRKIRLISSYVFKEKLMKLLLRIRGDRYFEVFVDEINSKIDSEILNKIFYHQNSQTQIILLSASPDYYVSKIAQKNNWVGFGSTFKKLGNKKNLHLYGVEKLKFILKYYPQQMFSYKYAVSDSDSDIELLKRFENYELKKNK